jgi:hypothetical protein
VCQYAGTVATMFGGPEKEASQFEEVWEKPGCAGVALKRGNVRWRVVCELVTNW